MNFAEGKKFAHEAFTINSGDFDQYSTEKLIEVLKGADDLYHNDEESFLEDNQYDALRQYVHAVNPSDPYFTSVGSDVRGGKIKLPFQMGSLNQVFIGEWDAFVRDNHLEDEELVASDKEDGGSDMLRYKAGRFQIAYSRGDGTMGADITRHLKHIADVPKVLNEELDMTVRCEHIISKPNFKKLLALGAKRSGGTPYKNPRNMVTGLMNSSSADPRFYQYINVIAYEIVGSKLDKEEQLALLKRLGFNVVPAKVMSGRKWTEKVLTDYLIERREKSEFEIDGVVVEVNDSKIRRKMDTGSLNPEYAVKFKVADASNYAVAEVKEVEWNISKDGYYKPRVRIKPVDLMGVTIQHLTGFNAKFIKDNKIGKGAKIKITRSGDVIPFIMGVETPAAQGDLPDDEDAVWSPTGVDLKVADVANNATVKFESLLDFFNSIDVAHLGEGNLRQIFDAGFELPEEVINLSQQDISTLVGSASIGKKIYTGMRAALTDIPLWKLMGSHPAFGRGVGTRKMKKLYDAWSGSMTLAAVPGSIVQVDGFDTKTATKIANGYDDFYQFFKAVEGVVTIAKFEAPKQGKLTGMTFVFTGFRNADLEQQTIAQGGAMGSAVSSKTTYLVTAEANSTSGKAKAARDKGVAVIGLEEFKKML